MTINADNTIIDLPAFKQILFRRIIVFLLIINNLHLKR